MVFLRSHSLSLTHNDFINLIVIKYFGKPLIPSKSNIVILKRAAAAAAFISAVLLALYCHNYIIVSDNMASLAHALLFFSGGNSLCVILNLHFKLDN
jgi:hypothetical protein